MFAPHPESSNPRVSQERENATPAEKRQEPVWQRLQRRRPWPVSSILCASWTIFFLLTLKLNESMLRSRNLDINRKALLCDVWHVRGAETDKLHFLTEKGDSE